MRYLHFFLHINLTSQSLLYNLVRHSRKIAPRRTPQTILPCGRRRTPLLLCTPKSRPREKSSSTHISHQEVIGGLRGPAEAMGLVRDLGGFVSTPRCSSWTFMLHCYPGNLGQKAVTSPLVIMASSVPRLRTIALQCPGFDS